MEKLKDRVLFKICSENSFSKNEIQGVLKNQVYQQPKDWKVFLEYLFLSLGVGFTTAGVVFFFAFNWDIIPDFVKLGTIQLLIISSITAAYFLKIKPNFKKILLTASCVLVGVLFAVFGQIYQTGANAYDFFLGWTIFISLWVIVVNFNPLWCIYLVLINTTLFLYTEQVANWEIATCFNWLTTCNFLALIALHFTPKINLSNWLFNILTTYVIGLSSIGVIGAIFENWHIACSISLIIYFSILFSSIWHAIKTQNKLIIALTGLSLICFISALILKITDFFDIGIFILLSFIAVIGTAITIQVIQKLDKQWNHGK